MFELTTTTRPAQTSAGAVATTRYDGPERRQDAPTAIRQWLAATLDEIDYGTLLLDADGQVVHVNHAARAELDEEHPLQLLGRQLRARRPQDVGPLLAALQGAEQRGLRRLITLGDPGRTVSVAVVPLPTLAPAGSASATLVLLGKRQVCGDFAVRAFARAHGLTAGETRVLTALCSGADPAEIAGLHGVAMSTVRTQIGSIRQKTGAESIRELVRQVAVLPPLMGALKQGGEPAANGLRALLSA